MGEVIKFPEGPKKASDMEMAEYYIERMSNIRNVNTRDFYLREAERILPTFKDAKAIKILRDKIENFDKFDPNAPHRR